MSIYDEFFDLEKPCPDLISDGEHLREEYKKRLKEINEKSGCINCSMRSLKAEFMTLVWKHYMKHKDFNA